MNTNKWIITVLAVQTALLLFLSYRVISLESRAVPALATSPVSQTSSTPPPVISAVKNSRASEFVRRDDIRAVMREEMDAIADKIIEAMDERPRVIEQEPASTMDPREVAGLRAEVTGQINSFSGQGVITPTELSGLERSISRLPPREQVKALQELNRAINNGNIEARF